MLLLVGRAQIDISSIMVYYTQPDGLKRVVRSKKVLYSPYQPDYPQITVVYP